MVKKMKQKKDGNFCFAPSVLDQKFRELLKRTSDGIVIVHIQSKQICFANRLWLKIMGYKASDLVDFKVKDCHPEGFKRKGVSIFNGLASGKISYAEKVLFVSKKGKESYINVSGIPMNIAGEDYLLAIFNDVTDEIHAQEKLEKAKEFSDLILEVTPSAVFTIDTKRRVVNWNKKAEELTGYTKAEVMGKKCSIFAGEPCSEKCGLFNGIAAKPIKNRECQIRTKDGRILFVSKNADYLRDEKGRIIGGIESFQDLTDRVKAEQALRDSEKRFKEVVENAKEWVWEVDIDGVYTYASSVVKDILGYSPVEIVGKKTFYDSFHNEDSEKLMKITAKYMRKKESFKNFINRNTHKDGSEVWLSTSGVPVYDLSGKIAGYRGVDTDITEQVKAEKELRKYAENLERLNDNLRETMNLVQEKDQRLFNSNEELEVTRDELEVMLHEVEAQRQFISEERDRLSAIFEKMGDGIIMVDSQRKVQLANDRVRKLLGFDSTDTIPEDCLDVFVGKLWKGLDKSKDVFAKVEIEIKDPKYTVLMVSVARILGGPEQGGFIGVVRDITHEKEIEQMKSDFVANVVHDLRSPMAPMKETISLMKDGMTGPLTEQQEKFLSILDNNVDRLLRLVSELLDLSKIEAGKIELKKEDINIVKLVNDVYESVDAFAVKKKIELLIKSSEEEVIICCDNDLITQVAFNLITNAIKFTPDGGKISLGVSIEEGKQKKYVVISVSDTGPGISKDNIKILFDRYKQLSSTARLKGSGLGLAISKAIVELHSGDIWVESEVGKGSSFKFRLPA